MLKYFYYLWNLLTKNEKSHLFYHFGKCLLSAILFTITDWNYLILLWMIGNTAVESIIYAIIGVQLFSLFIGFWYYFVKYQIMVQQNYFYKLLSSRHYAYILNRISNNASYQWISQKSPNILTKQLDSTEKGIQHVFSFITQFVRLVSVSLLSIFIISFSYKSCAILFALFFIIVYYIYRNGFINSAERIKFRKDNQYNTLVISNNLSLLFDSIIHDNFKKVITNIVTYNDRILQGKIQLFSQENRMFIKIGLFLMSCFIIMLTLVSMWMGLNLQEFIIFFIATLLTYKCIAHNMNELCDIYADVRQTEMDFEALEDIWSATKTKRPSFETINLPAHKLSSIKNYNNFKMCVKSDTEESCFKKYLSKNKIKTSLSLTEYLVKNKNQIIDYVRFRRTCNIPTELELYNEYLTSSFYDKPKEPLYEIRIDTIQFAYGQNENLFTLELKQPLIIKSNDHIVLIGPSGCGKTTFLKIIRGILPIEKIDMKLIIDTLKKYQLTWNNLANSVCYSQQNSISFIGGTVYQILSDNFISPLNSKDEPLMKQALTIACVDPLFMDLSFICTKNTISGGQQQRLAIAKIIYRVLKSNCPIILLDEIDAGINLELAQKIIINIKILLKDRLVIYVLHTQELINMFNLNNRIYIDDGMIKTK